MVGTYYVGHYKSLGNRVYQILGNEEVVNSPPHIPCPGSGFHIPPGILMRLLVEVAKGIDVAMSYQLVHPIPLNGQKS